MEMSATTRMRRESEKCWKIVSSSVCFVRCSTTVFSVMIAITVNVFHWRTPRVHSRGQRRTLLFVFPSKQNEKERVKAKRTLKGKVNDQAHPRTSP
jgi:hypothetical protein